MVVSLETDLRFPIPGQQGHGGRIIQLPADYDFESHKELVPMQPGDVPVTFADTEPLERDYGFKPDTSLRDGLRKFAVFCKCKFLKFADKNGEFCISVLEKVAGCPAGLPDAS